MGCALERRFGYIRCVGLEEPLDDGAAKVLELLWVAGDGLDERRIEEVELEELPEEVDDVADLAVLEDLGGLRADLRLRRLRVHSFDDAEPRAKDAPEDAVRGSLVTRRAAEDARRGRLCAHPNEEVTYEAGLANAGGAKKRDGPTNPAFGDVVERVLELAHLCHAPDEHRTPLGNAEPRGRHEADTVRHDTARVAPPSMASLVDLRARSWRCCLPSMSARPACAAVL